VKTPQTNEAEVVIAGPPSLSFYPGLRVYLDQGGRRFSGLISQLQYRYDEPRTFFEAAHAEFNGWTATLSLCDVRDEPLPAKPTWWDRLKVTVKVWWRHVVDFWQSQTG
jgi:hypothetical protein